MNQEKVLFSAPVEKPWEETGIIAKTATAGGILCFSFIDGLRLRVSAFITDDFTGEIEETDEAIPYPAAY